MHRRVYLTEEKSKNEHLRPPNYVMTKKQSKRFLNSVSSASTEQIKNNMKFAGLALKEDDVAKSKKGSQQKKAQSKKKVVYLQTYSSTNPGT